MKNLKNLVYFILILITMISMLACDAVPTTISEAQDNADLGTIEISDFVKFIPESNDIITLTENNTFKITFTDNTIKEIDITTITVGQCIVHEMWIEDNSSEEYEYVVGCLENTIVQPAYYFIPNLTPCNKLYVSLPWYEPATYSDGKIYVSFSSTDVVFPITVTLTLTQYQK